MKKHLRAFICTILMSLFTTTIFANDYVKFKGWKQAETTHFRFIYEAASEPAAQAYARIADEAWEKIARIYSMPQEKTDVYVFGRMNIVNAYTFFTPPEIVMYDSPILESTFGFRDDWMKLFFTHELIHIANISFEDKEYLAAKLMGEAFRGWDYSMIPGWALEGLTTVLETELTNGGRGRSPYFELNYKAPTLDNNFIPYRLIGTEQEPPYSQIYVMGYLIMRSIADRWGLQALADIERNRSIERSWEESVKLVTGKTPQDIYREAKIALEKKYSKERTIPEGRIISPNDTNTNYQRPAIIFDDGSMICVRTDMNDSKVVLLRPSAKDGMNYIEDDEELKETIILKGSEEITADENMNIYYTSWLNRYDRNPYTETEFALFKWSKNSDGSYSNEQLTSNQNSYYQPAVSRNGNLLVAVEQKGLKMRIVSVDTQTGKTTPLFEDERYSFIQPAVNSDGTKVAFLLLKEDRACVALGDPKTGEYKIINNTDHDFITDPSTPSFNKDGKLTFCSNDRGRLEIYEAVANSDGQTFTCTPVLSDPIAALWSYKNDMAVFYTSYASTGFVIKIKPVEEWGKIADFEGPSPAGQIMTFGELQNDYPEFNPYAVVVQEKEQYETNDADSTEDNSTAKEESQTIKRRSEEAIAKLENLKPATKELTNQKGFVPYVTPLLYMPFFNTLTDADKAYFGFGGFFVGALPRLQMRQGYIYLDAFYFPDLKNFTGEFALITPLFAGSLDLLISRNSINLNSQNDPHKFNLQNTFILGYTLPIFSREQYSVGKELDFITYTGATISQSDTKPFSLTSKIPFTKEFSATAGLDYKQHMNLQKEDTINFDITNLALATWDFSKNKLFAGYEGEFSIGSSSPSANQEAGIIVRYTDFPVQTIPTMSRAHFNGSTEDCLFPGKILLNYTYTIPNLLSGIADGNIILQGLASFGKNSVDKGTPQTGKPLNLKLEKKLNMGAELSFILGANQKLAIGYAALFDFEKNISQSTRNFYISCKLNWLRF